VAGVVDPLGGSYYLEWLTGEIEARAWGYIQKIDELGGIIRAIELGYPQREIAETAYRDKLREDRGELVTVGVNQYVQEEESPIHYLRIDEAVEREQMERVGQVKASRDRASVERQLTRIADAARDGKNLMPVLIDAVKEYVSVGEIADVYRQVFGRYHEPIIY